MAFTKRGSSSLIAVIAVLLLILVLVAALVFKRDQVPLPYHALNPDYRAVVDCPLTSSACVLHFDDFQMSIALQPEGLPALTPLVLSMDVPTPLARESADLKIWLEGKNMQMGRYLFSPLGTTSPAQDAIDQPKRFQAVIPVCTIDKNMVWLLQVQFLLGEKRYRFVFELQSRH